MLAVVAHPDDESFGLGAIIDKMTLTGAAVHVLCYTRGEASTLHQAGADLIRQRAREPRQAGAALGVSTVALLDYGKHGTPGRLPVRCRLPDGRRAAPGDGRTAPLGTGDGPNAARVLAAAIANCLSASALFCLRKALVDVRGMRTWATASMVRDERGRLRVGAVDVQIQPETAPADSGRIGRCLELFEDYCVVTQSVRTGLPVTVEVKPVHTAPATAGTKQQGRDRPTVQSAME